MLHFERNTIEAIFSLENGIHGNHRFCPHSLSAQQHLQHQLQQSAATGEWGTAREEAELLQAVLRRSGELSIVAAPAVGEYFAHIPTLIAPPPAPAIVGSILHICPHLFSRFLPLWMNIRSTLSWLPPVTHMSHTQIIHT